MKENYTPPPERVSEVKQTTSDVDQSTTHEQSTTPDEIDRQTLRRLSRFAIQALPKDAEITVHQRPPEPQPRARQDEDEYRLIPRQTLTDPSGTWSYEKYDYASTNAAPGEDEEDYYDDDEDEDEFYWDEESEEWVLDQAAVERNRLKHPEQPAATLRTEFDSLHREFKIFPLPEEILTKFPFLSELPHDVGVMGGTVRSIARKLIAGDDEPIRDIDLVQIESPSDPQPSDFDTLDSLAQEYMPDDYAYGHGINTETLDGYFRTRDFTVNEALILDGALLVSNYAYNDLQENIIRPTFYEKQECDSYDSSRTVMRALSMQATLLESASSYPTLEDFDINSNYIRSFDVAVQLNKMMSRGAEVARRFTDLLANYNIVPPEFAGKPVATAKYLLDYRVYSFEFRANDDDRVGEFAKTQEDFNVVSAFHATDSAIRAALAEYEDAPRAERTSGAYTQAEFDDINRHWSD